jgi:hypothetical protein
VIDGVAQPIPLAGEVWSVDPAPPDFHGWCPYRARSGIDRASSELLAAVSGLRELDDEAFPREVAQATIDACRELLALRDELEQRLTEGTTTK